METRAEGATKTSVDKKTCKKNTRIYRYPNVGVSSGYMGAGLSVFFLESGPSSRESWRLSWEGFGGILENAGYKMLFCWLSWAMLWHLGVKMAHKSAKTMQDFLSKMAGSSGTNRIAMLPTWHEAPARPVFQSKPNFKFVVFWETHGNFPKPEISRTIFLRSFAGS